MAKGLSYPSLRILVRMINLCELVIRFSDVRLTVLFTARQTELLVRLVYGHDRWLFLDFFLPSVENIFQQVHLSLGSATRK